MKKNVEKITPQNFEAENHFYPKALNAQIHPMVSHFLHLSNERLLNRYVHLNPRVNKNRLEDILSYRCRYFHWAGADLFYVTTELGNRKMVVLETNSCPSGQKSMPLRSDWDEHRGYRDLIEKSFLPQLKGRRLPKGSLGVLYDKNYMEASGYAQTLSDLSGETVYLIPFYDEKEVSQETYFEDGVLKFHYNGEAMTLRACLRYVTQKPWNRIPVYTKTFVFNPSIVCLSGGRNKLIATKAYEIFNSKVREDGLHIHTPETIRDVSKLEVPLWVDRFGGFAVIKIPYSNAGQGVFTITSQKELDDFMEKDYGYDQFIVQSLIGHHNWSSKGEKGKFYHIGTVPNKRGDIFVADLRMMICSTPEEFIPTALYARKTRKPLIDKLNNQESSWDILGTNLSIKKAENEWESDTGRLVLMDRKDFNTLGIGVDDLIEAYIQSVLSVVAIDQMSCNLINQKGQLRHRLFRSMDRDEGLLNEIF